MIEIWLFGSLLVTLPSAASIVFLILALTSVTYLGMTLVPVLARGGGHDGAASGPKPRASFVGDDRGARLLGVASAAGTLLLAALGLRVGSAGSGGEIVPTFAVSVALAAAGGSAAAFAAVLGARATRLLGAARASSRAALQSGKQEEARRLEASRRAYLGGEDIRAEVQEADAALSRLRSSLGKLAETRATIAARLDAMEPSLASGDLARELRRTRDEIAAKLELGDRILQAADAAAFRIACSAPLRLLLRRRPRDLVRGLAEGMDPAAAIAIIGSASAAIDAFLGETEQAKRGLATLAGRRKPAADSDELDDDLEDDAYARAERDLQAIAGAYAAVKERLSVVSLRLAARADMDAVATAAGEVSDKAQRSGVPAEDLRELVDEVTRAESAILMATPGELDAKNLTDALSRGAAALGGRDGASLDELLRALRVVV
jgi:hypothetical protein